MSYDLIRQWLDPILNHTCDEEFIRVRIEQILKKIGTARMAELEGLLVTRTSSCNHLLVRAEFYEALARRLAEMVCRLRVVPMAIEWRYDVSVLLAEPAVVALLKENP